MGDPIRIQDLARQMIRFYGFEPDEEIRIDYTGLRPGEKMTETLWAGDEKPEETEYPGISLLNRSPRLKGELSALLEELNSVCYFQQGREEFYRNRIRIRDVLSRYIPSLEIPDDEPEY